MDILCGATECRGGAIAEALGALAGLKATRSSSLDSPDAPPAGSDTTGASRRMVDFLGLRTDGRGNRPGVPSACKPPSAACPMPDLRGLRTDSLGGRAAAPSACCPFSGSTCGGVPRPDACGDRMLMRGVRPPLLPAVSCRPAGGCCRVDAEACRNVDSLLGDRSSSSSLDSALGPSDLVGVVGRAPLMLARGGDEVVPMKAAVALCGPVANPLSPHNLLNPSSRGRHPSHLEPAMQAQLNFRLPTDLTETCFSIQLAPVLPLLQHA